MDHPRFDYVPITQRPALQLPGSARVAVWVCPAVEYFDVNKPITTIKGAKDGPLSPSGYGWYSYGVRVGIFRLMDVLARVGIRPSAILNSDVCAHYPEIIAAGRANDWCWLAHGKTNNDSQSGFTDIEAERQYLREMAEVLHEHLGYVPRGWLGPALTESPNTLDLLAELGLDYVCDWVADDQPFPMRVKSGRMISVPYAVDGLNDVRLRDRGFTGEDYFRVIVDQFDTLYEEGATVPRVMCIVAHPHITGQPFRARWFERALRHIASHPQVWLATSDEIAQWYYADYYQEPKAR